MERNERLTLREAQQKLRIDRDQLDHAVIDQSVLFYDVSEALVRAKDAKDQAKSEMENVAAEVGTELRKKHKDDKKKMTEGSLKEMVCMDEEYSDSYALYLTSVRELGSWEAMKEAYTQRSYMIRELARLWAANYYGDSSISGGNDVKDAVNRNHRSAIDKVRREKKVKRRELKH